MNDTELLTEMLGAVRELAERVERIEATVRENCNAAKILTSRRERNRLRMVNNRAEQKYVRAQTDVRAQKEKEAEIRDIPPTPPIENKGEEKEKVLECITARAREEESIGESMVINVTPTLETVLKYVQLHGDCYTEEEARDWYKFESERAFWLDNNGEPIKNWVRAMDFYIRNKRKEEKREKQRDEEHERKMAYYTPRQQTANNQPKGVVLKREGEEHHARW